MAHLPSNACVYPFKAAMVMHGVPATPCCRFHTRHLSDADREHEFKDIRETMLRNEWHEGCYKCKADEDVGKSSMRTEADEFFNTFDDTFQLEYLEITVGRLCNLACVGCGPEYSHTWDKDAEVLNIVPQETLEHFLEHREYDLDQLRTEDLRHLKFLKITGGEPFMHIKFLRFLQRLSDEGIAPNVEIEIFTNCTYWPAKMNLDHLLQFKKLTITASIDAVGELNDVLRYPSNFDKMESTLMQWTELRDQYDNVEIFVACTVGVMNAPAMYDYMVWARKKMKVPVILQTIYEPHWLSINHWPNWFKRDLKLLVDKQFAGADEKLMKAHKLITSLCKDSDNNDNSVLYLEHMQVLLELRGQSIDAAPNFKQLLVNENR